MKFRRFRGLVAPLTLLAVLMSIPSSLVAQPKPYTIGVILPMTGPGANLGQDLAAGLNAFEVYANKTGGIRGTPLHFEVADDQSQPVIAVQLFQPMLAAHPAVVIGGALTGVAQAMAPSVVKEGPVLYGLTPNLSPSPHGYLFATSALVRDIIGVGVTYYKARGLTKIATIVTNDASGQTGLEATEASIALPANKGAMIVDRESFSNSDVSMDAQAARIKASGAQVVFALTSGTAFGTALHGLNDVGLDLPVFTAAANFSPVLQDRFKTFLPKELTSSGPSFFNRDRAANDPLKKPIDDFYDALAAQNITVPIVTYAFVWDPALIITSGLRALGPSATAAQLRDYIEKQRHFPGVQGIYDFGSGNQHGLTLAGLLVLRSDPDHPGRPIVVSRQGGLPL